MGKRLRVGLVYSNNQNWIGGTYYIENLIRSLNFLQQREQFKFILLTENKEDYIRLREDFTDLYYKNPNRYARTIPGRLINKVWMSLFHRKPLINNLLSYKDIDILFPDNGSIVYQKINGKIFWIADFQEYYFPDFFSLEEVVLRKKFHQQIASSVGKLVVSSENAKNDFLKYYPNAKCTVHIVRFAVTLPSFEDLNIEFLLKKYKITSKYFMCPNQFWQHKNHGVILNAIQILKASGNEILVVFTGKEHDHRNPEYTTQLKQFVTENHLEKNTLFLGFIDRKEQLKLIANAIAIIQPSLFEGWSTVVEDSKAIGQYIILSDIPIHREQIQKNCTFFDPYSEIDLATKLIQYADNRPTLQKHDYTTDIKEFSSSFLSVIGN